MNYFLLGIVFIVYFLMVGYVGYLAWKRTNSSEDFLVAGRETHPYIMALSYGATFISTAAIVGFGGVAGKYGMGILWLAFLNILVGIFIAFVFFGKRTRKMGKNLNSLTFPEFLGRRFDSKFIQYFSGVLIFCAMPIYAAVVLIGAARFMESSLMLDFNLALFILAVVICGYVLFGGLKGVMYTDALQGTIMFIGMLILLVFIYWVLGGVTEANTALTNMAHLYPPDALAEGGTGWTSFPKLGSPFWWTLVTTIIMGVGIGALAQPQLAVRFMTVKSNKELHRSLLIGAVFIAVMTGTAYIVGSLCNVYFYQNFGQIAIDYVGGNMDSIIPTFISTALPEWFVYIFLLSLLAAAMSTLSSQYHTQGTALGHDIVDAFKNRGTTREYTDEEILEGSSKEETRIGFISVSQLGILIAVVLSLIIGLILPGGIVALGTSLFMGLCAAAFLPVYCAALFWKRATRKGAIAGLLSGTFTSLFLLVFVYKKTAVGLGICKALTGMDMLINVMPWYSIDVMVFAIPVSVIFTVVVSLLSPPMDEKVIKRSFEGLSEE
ncbi:transporter SSS family [Methanobrevibacter ruminantium M1]|uniref:Transporter SSS family n=1 Tax=Methanobrevibacter ruminantium (strain ATCC 35063 / DSM 1093 / JCM 13430 / OCM 146 / M1) TaxID=634498 RepID=D3DZF8_METRM|nr:sodium:solute symporter family protein [Methanobrevibacter ruminantium]ADC47636.1 transporter SSS family [Methanobrevibacter ruminantium M1]